MNLLNNMSQRVVRGDVRVASRAGDCLVTVREVIEAALKWPERGYYVMVASDKSPHTNPVGKYAADAEYSHIRRGLVSKGPPKPGSIVFGNIPSPAGHVGLVFQDEHDGKLYVLESTGHNRGRVLYGSLRVTPLAEWDPITTVAHLPRAWVEVPDPVPTKIPPPVPGKVRIFEAAGGRFVTQTTLVEGTDKVYIPGEFLDERFK